MASSCTNLIPKHGGYRKPKSVQVAQLVYDITVRFCDKYIDKFSLTKDQMVQAARSGVQNIAEGSQASSTKSITSAKSTQSTLSTKTHPEFSVNAALVLLAVACTLLDRQVGRLAQDFEKEGDFTKRLYRVRASKRRVTS